MNQKNTSLTKSPSRHNKMAPFFLFGVLLISLFFSLVKIRNTTTPPPEPIVSIDTSMWQEYINTRYNFTFKYPENWYMTERVAKKELGTQKYITIGPVSSGEVKIPGIFEVLVNPGVEGYYSRNCGELDNCIKKSIGDIPYEISVSDEMLLGNKAKRVIYEYPSGTKLVETVHLYVILQGNFYDIYAYSDKESFELVNKAFSLFLDSFKIMN